MEWIRISDNKLKIMLTAEDARHFALQCENADYAEVLTREAFREILAAVREETGFDTTEEKLYIQMYPSKEGGCELFVTKMGLLLAEHPNEKNTLPTPPAERGKQTKRTPLPRKRSTAFLFEELEDLLALCRRLSQRNYIGESEIWQDEVGGWWLILTDNSSPLTARDDYRFIREYGKMLCGGDAQLFLPEHGKCICARGAVEVFAKL